jgi:arsenate reductase-like glutaredoxin family protein
MSPVQIFGVKNSNSTRAAERFFKERRVPIQFVDLKVKPMAPAEIRRFVQRFGLERLIDTESAAWIDAGLRYLKMTETDLLARIERDPRLLRLPLVRLGNLLAVGQDEAAWKEMSAPAK